VLGGDQLLQIAQPAQAGAVAGWRLHEALADKKDDGQRRQGQKGAAEQEGAAEADDVGQKAADERPGEHAGVDGHLDQADDVAGASSGRQGADKGHGRGLDAGQRADEEAQHQ